MKKVSFLVAILAVLQVSMGQRIAQGQERLRNDRRTVEEALDRAGDDLGLEIERLAEELGADAQRLGETMERWAENNAQELEAWSEKYADQWESWGQRLEKKMERLAQDQEGIWEQWGQKYEQNLNQWADELESEELDPEHFGEFVEDNLKMLSKMPLGQLVDRALEDGLGELGDAPWESLEELGHLAKDALEETVDELEVVLEQGNDRRRTLERGARELSRSLDQLKDDIGRNIRDDDRPERARDAKVDPQVRALKMLRERDGLTAEQRDRIDEMIKTIQDAGHLRDDRRLPDRREPRIDVPRRDQILEKIDRERKRHEQTLRQFNEDLRRSSEESRKSEMRAREIENRKPKRVDGKNRDENSKVVPKAKAPSTPRPRWNLGSPETKKPAANRKQNSKNPKAESEKSKLSDVEMLRREIEKLRKEVQELKKKTGR